MLQNNLAKLVQDRLLCGEKPMTEAEVSVAVLFILSSLFESFFFLSSLFNLVEWVSVELVQCSWLYIC